ncbi:aminoglycoside phosphotransferase family protein [Parachitinimonas caeni]|uniref:Phosphotransferase n=1 Tax=Parachitinimonas caeni TaxID=3031301 RepID=A0ABT7DV13_9NEIS|nr:phosphotransferase [Parachitinimonas caeni]MDK2122487.1 phosphotransferase [Parachitinimonas caeni]
MLRLQQLESWLTGLYPDSPFSLAPASADASFRRYFRVSFADGRSLIAMDAPPQHEDCRPFVRIAGLFDCVNVPKVIQQDLEQGFLLLTDLGSTTYLAAMHPEKPEAAQALYRDAISALVAIQKASMADTLPPYDAALLRRELQLYPEWYVARHLGKSLDDKQQATWDRVTALILANNLAQPKVYVHRDFHSRNLMVTEPNPGVLDFQDAVYGPITYDLVSLLRDAYIEWPEEFVLDLVIRYWEQARAAQLPVPTDFAEFYRDFEWMGVQRQLKVIGIFARLCHRDGKSGYLNDIPLVMRYLRKACARYAELRALLRLVDELEGVSHHTGYTF